jgi:hypothetical protein
MTRVTNLAFKRKYHEAGFDRDSASYSAAPEGNAEPPKKRSRNRKQNTTSDHDANHQGDGDSQPPLKHIKYPDIKGGFDSKMKSWKGSAEKSFSKKGSCTCFPRPSLVPFLIRNTGKSDIKEASERRRLRRINDKRADTVCFACREKGHELRDCPKSRNLKGNADEKQLSGICFRYIIHGCFFWSAHPCFAAVEAGDTLWRDARNPCQMTNLTLSLMLLALFAKLPGISPPLALPTIPKVYIQMVVVASFASRILILRKTAHYLKAVGSQLCKHFYLLYLAFRYSNCAYCYR